MCTFYSANMALSDIYCVVHQNLKKYLKTCFNNKICFKHLIENPLKTQGNRKCKKANIFQGFWTHYCGTTLSLPADSTTVFWAVLYYLQPLWFDGLRHSIQSQAWQSDMDSWGRVDWCLTYAGWNEVSNLHTNTDLTVLKKVLQHDCFEAMLLPPNVMLLLHTEHA